MPSSLAAQMTRRAISPRLAIRIFRNIRWVNYASRALRSARPNRKQRLAVFHRTAVLHELGRDDAGHLPLDFIHKLHRFDDAQDLAGLDAIATSAEGRGA